MYFFLVNKRVAGYWSGVT